MNLRLLLLIAPGLLAGCSTLTTHVEPKADLGAVRHVFVVENLNDNHDLHGLIVRELQARGLQAESGPLTLRPTDAKVYLNYDDRWNWDFTNYLIGLNLTLREANSDRLLATASYFRPTAFLKTPDFMVRTVLAALFKAGGKPRHASPAETPGKPAGLTP
jgi:hypothetical protein